MCTDFTANRNDLVVQFLWSSQSVLCVYYAIIFFFALSIVRLPRHIEQWMQLHLQWLKCNETRKPFPHWYPWFYEINKKQLEMCLNGLAGCSYCVDTVTVTACSKTKPICSSFEWQLFAFKLQRVLTKATKFCVLFQKPQRKMHWEK